MESESGVMVSSLSRNVNQVPLADLIPMLRAADTPEFTSLRIFIRGSFRAYSSAIFSVSSVEPSFTTIASKSEKDCARTLSRHSRRYSCALYAGIITEILGSDITSHDTALRISNKFNDFITLVCSSDLCLDAVNSI